jgi:sugar lactone lactonase YvrE
MRKLIIGVVAAIALLGVPVAAGVATAAPAATCASASTGDSLYVGDNTPGDYSVKQFDAATGCYQRVFVSTSEGLDGPRAILHEGNFLHDGNFLVSNQNIDHNYPGEIDRYSPVDGQSLGALVPPTTAANAPCDPDGIILGPDKSTLYVADLGDCLHAVARVATYNANTGQFLGNLDFSSFISNTAINPHGYFTPRGLVFGPGGLLYVSVSSSVDLTAGWILSYNTRTGAVRVVASNSGSGCSTELHRPDGLTFGPDGKLYVTSFRAERHMSTDIDRILIFNAATGACTDEIDLDQLGQPRAFAQDILFGPGGYLFVPNAAPNPDEDTQIPDPYSGAVRRYNVRTKTFTNFIAPSPSGGPPVQWWWGLTFGRTNPTTLAYESF